MAYCCLVRAVHRRPLSVNVRRCCYVRAVQALRTNQVYCRWIWAFPYRCRNCENAPACPWKPTGLTQCLRAEYKSTCSFHIAPKAQSLSHTVCIPCFSSPACGIACTPGIYFMTCVPCLISPAYLRAESCAWYLIFIS